ncbi:RNA-directed DNA polymerase-like protein [Gossypium australe]|uniref:RNA-directed DNA polymerase-like protein n=1 Tax=Gossypium australe TaxID=47621 RepID=A0A5B6VBH3_9ROSI|nr:RNA-directed DNA polymerase-like protein [Gossypium australe]
MQELDRNGNPSDMSLVSYEFIWFKRGSLVEHQVSLDCAVKRVTLKITSSKEIVMASKGQDYLSNVISTLVVKKLV